MLRQQRRGLLGELRAQGHALLGQPADQFGIGDVGAISIGCPEATASRISRARASASAFCARAADTWVLSSVSCWFDRLVLLLPKNRLELGAERLDLALGLRHLVAQLLKLAGQPFAGGARLILLRHLLERQVFFRDHVGDLRRQAPDRPTGIRSRSRATCRSRRPEPVVIGGQHPLLQRHRHRILEDADGAQDTDSGENSLQRRVELRQLGRA